MTNAHLMAWAVDKSREANEAGTIIDHATARQIVHANTWGWATCWFDGTGDFVFPWDFNTGGKGDPVSYMDKCLFGWWADSEDSKPFTDEDRITREALRRYMQHRIDSDDIGDVEGWKDLPKY